MRGGKAPAAKRKTHRGKRSGKLVKLQAGIIALEINKDLKTGKREAAYQGSQMRERSLTPIPPYLSDLERESETLDELARDNGLEMRWSGTEWEFIPRDQATPI